MGSSPIGRSKRPSTATPRELGSPIDRHFSLLGPIVDTQSPLIIQYDRPTDRYSHH
jgi:hypothetical protein